MKEDLKVNQYHSSIQNIHDTEGKSFISAFMEEVKQIYDHNDDCRYDPKWNDEKRNNTVMMFGSSGIINSTRYILSQLI